MTTMTGTDQRTKIPCARNEWMGPFVLALILAGMLAVGSSASTAPTDLPIEQDQAPIVTGHPDIVVVITNNEAGGFRATATGYPQPTVQWQVARDRQGPWTDIFGATDTNLYFKSSFDDADTFGMGHAFRAVFTNRAGTAVSRPARLVWRTEWMKNLGSDIDDRPLTELTIPGSHDMGTYGINADSPDSTDGNPHLVRITDESILAMCVGSLFGFSNPLDCVAAILAVYPVHTITEHYARAQSTTKNATHELDDGIRYFDLRICGPGELVTCHGLEAAPLQEILDQTRSWVDAHPDEVVFLDFNHHFEVDLNTEGARIDAAFATANGSLLIPPQYCTVGVPASGICGHDLTLAKARQLGRVIVNFENDGQPAINDAFYDYHWRFWGRGKTSTFTTNGSECTTGGAGTSCFGNNAEVDTVLSRVLDTLTRLKGITDPLQQQTHPQRFFVQFLQTTPDGGYIFTFEHIFQGLLEMAQASNPKIGPAVFGCDETHSCFGQFRPENLNILPINYYEYKDYDSVHFDFIKEVITFNAYARTPPVVNMSTPFTPAQSGWYNAAALGGTGTTLPVDVFAEDYRYPTGIGSLDCDELKTTTHLSSATTASSVSYRLNLHDGVHTEYCYAADGAKLGFHGYGNTGFGPGSTPDTRPVVYKVDTTPPTVQCPGDPIFLLNQPLATIEGAVTDATSGPAQSSVSATAATNAVGTYSTNLTGSDVAGNTTTVSCSYKVTYRIVPRYDTTKAWKSGSIVSIRVELQDYYGMDMSDKSITVTAVSVTNTLTAATMPPTSPGATNPNFVFYVSPAKGYVYDLRTTGYASAPYALDFVATGDPITHQAPFVIR